MKISKIASLCLIASTTFIIGCGSGNNSNNGNNSSKVQISGNLGSTYAFYKTPWYEKILPLAYAANFGQIKNAIAIPLVGSDVIISQAKNVTINNDGTFNVDLAKQITDPDTQEKYNLHWIVLLEKLDGSFSFLSIPNSSDSDTLIDFPIGKATTNHIDLGTIDNSGDEGISSKNLNNLTSDVTMNINQLNNLAKIDDTTKSVINSYKNNYGKSEDNMIDEILHVVISGDYTKINTQYTIANTFQGYSFHFDAGKDTSLAKHFTDLCGTDNYLQLVPPTGATITAGGNNYTASAPLSSTHGTITNLTDGEQECSGGITYFKKNNDGSVTVNLITGDTSSVLATTKPIPNGDFKLKLNNSTIGEYLFSYNLPITNNGNIKIPVPKIKLNLNSNNKVLGVYVKWYVYDKSTSQYNEINASTLANLTDTYSIHMDDFNGITSNTARDEIDCDDINISQNYIDVTKCQNYPTNGMYYNYSGEDKYSLDDVNVVLNLGSTETRFTYRRQ